MISSCSVVHRFCARKTNIFTLFGFNDALYEVTMFPDVLNCLSDVQLVAQMHRYFLESCESIGYTVE